MSDDKKPAIRFKDYSDDWEQRKLGELGTITTGSTPSTAIPDYYSDDGIVWVTPTDICENITFESARKLSDLGQQVGRVVPKNTILVTCIASIGKNTMLGSTGSFNQQINGLTPNENECAPYFLLTESALWSAKMKSSAAAGTMQIVNRTEFSELKTWLPSLIEQQAISDFFRQLDHLITLHQRKYDKLQNLKKAMLEKMFPKNGSNVPEIRFKGFTDAWEQRKLIEVCDYVDYRGKTPTKTEDGIFLVTAKNVKDGFIDYETSKEYISENTYEEVMRRGKPEIGDVLITTEAPCGNVAQVNKADIALAQRIIKYRGHIGVVDNTYLKHYLLSPEFQKILNAKSSGGTVQGIKGSILHQQKIIYPSYEEQKKIGQHMDSLDTLITLHQRELEKLKNIKKALLEKMFV